MLYARQVFLLDFGQSAAGAVEGQGNAIAKLKEGIVS
jgi:hypothetical protein